MLPFGVADVDKRLPASGLQLGHVHEFSEAGPAGEYAGLATLFAAGIAARIQGPVLWCLRGRDLFAPALSRVRLHPDRVIYCETWHDRDVLPAMEEGLRCKGLGAVVVRDLTAKLRHVSGLDAAFPLAPGRGDEGKQGGHGPDSRDPKPIAKPRDMYEPDLHIDSIKLKARNFR